MSIHTYFIEKCLLYKEERYIFITIFIICKKYLILIVFPIVLMTNKIVYKLFYNHKSNDTLI